MKKFISGVIFLLLFLIPIPFFAETDIHINITSPPQIVIQEPPQVIVIPETYVYVIPEIEIELYFWNGWWWRLWEGCWYRSRHYNTGWNYYNGVPSFYFDIEPDWRRYYREGHWYGYPWHYERIPYKKLQQNWKIWQDKRYWEKRKVWGVEGYRPRPFGYKEELRRQREQEYYRGSDVQKIK